MKSAVPVEPKETAKDAVNAAKDGLPEPPKDIPNPLQNLFGELIGIIMLSALRLLKRRGVRIVGTPVTLTAWPHPVALIQGLLLYKRPGKASMLVSLQVLMRSDCRMYQVASLRRLHRTQHPL